MRVTLTPHETIRGAYAAWRRTLDPDRARRRELAAVYWSELERRVIAAGGIPDGAVPDAGAEPGYWAELTGGTWVKLVVKPDTRTGAFRTRVRRVLAVDIQPGPPRPPSPAAPRT